VLDQTRTMDKSRLLRRLAHIEESVQTQVLSNLVEVFAEQPCTAQPLRQTTQHTTCAQTKTWGLRLARNPQVSS